MSSTPPDSPQPDTPQTKTPPRKRSRRRTAGIVALAIGPSWLKMQERREMQATVRQALDNGQPLPPEVIDALSKDIKRRLPSRTRDVRAGVILFALGAGVALTACVIGQFVDYEAFAFSAFGAIPACLGLAFILLSFFNSSKD